MNGPPGQTASRSGNLPWIVAAVLLVAVVALGVVVVTGDDDEADEAEVAGEEVLFEPASSIGPNAFTAPVTVEPGICDTAALIRELESRPDALREWAEVLEVPVESVPAYIETLEPRVLETDTAVTNHGLRDGQAYPRASVLQAGTAVLVDTEASAVVMNLPPESTPEVPEVPSSSTAVPTTPDSTVASTTTTAMPTTTGPATTLPDGGLPVTRCKCGNPLLPPGVEDFTPGTPQDSDTTGPPQTTPSTAPPSVSSSSSSSSSSSVPDSSSSSSTSTPNGGSSSTSEPDDGSSTTTLIVTPEPSYPEIDGAPPPSG